MEQKSRTEYSAANTTVAVLSRVTAILMGYLTRVVFTRMLSESYVGVNGLFTDILNVLSLSELGIEVAISYALYRPIAQGDEEKQKSIMYLYCRIYRIVAAVIAGAGLLLIPFFDILIKNRPDVEHFTLIYLLYLGNTVLSYLMIYKKTLIDAHQLSYIGTVYKTIAWVVQDVLQILVLLQTRNFILFLLIYIVCTLISNILISRKADRLYPFLREMPRLSFRNQKYVKPLSKEEKRDILLKTKAMMMHKLGTVVVNNTDNLLLSSFVGIISVGCYSNYYLLIGSIRQVVDQMFGSITASVGNLGVLEGSGHIKRVFESVFFLSQWVYGFAAICLYELLNPFVELSFGKQYLFSKDIVLVLCINFFVTGMRRAVLVFRDSTGIFWFDRYKSIIEAAINLGVSILLVTRMGTIGVFLGTLVSTVLTSLWVEPLVLYKHLLGCSSLSYFLRYGLYTAVTAICWMAVDKICAMVTGGLSWVICLRLLICLTVPNVIMVAVYARTKEFRFVWKKGLGVLRGISAKRGKGL